MVMRRPPPRTGIATCGRVGQITCLPFEAGGWEFPRDKGREVYLRVDANFVAVIFTIGDLYDSRT